MATTNFEIAPDEQQNLKKILSSDKPLALTTDDAPEARVTLPERAEVFGIEIDSSGV